MSSYCGSAPAFTIAMSSPARIAWYRNTAWIASRTRSLPRNANETLDTPPETRTSGSSDLEPARRLEEGVRVVGVLLDARGDREDVGVEDDVLVGEARLLGEQLVGPHEHGDPPLHAVGLALLVERHDDRRRAVPAAQPGLAQELVLALLERDRVDDAAALELPQPGLDDRPLRAVDHDRDRGDVRLGAQAPQEARHRGDAVEHRLVHVHVEHDRAVLRPGRARSRRPRPRPRGRRRRRARPPPSAARTGATRSRSSARRR